MRATGATGAVAGQSNSRGKRHGLGSAPPPCSWAQAETTAASKTWESGFDLRRHAAETVGKALRPLDENRPDAQLTAVGSANTGLDPASRTRHMIGRHQEHETIQRSFNHLTASLGRVTARTPPDPLAHPPSRGTPPVWPLVFRRSRFEPHVIPWRLAPFNDRPFNARAAPVQLDRLFPGVAFAGNHGDWAEY